LLRLAAIVDVAALLQRIHSLDAFGGAVFSLVVNVLVFVATLLFGEVVTCLWKRHPIASPPLPVSRTEVALAASCVVLNSVVMFVGWLLFRVDVVRVDPTESWLRWLVDALVLVAVMDFAMYVTHRLAHHPIAFRYVHGIHHRYDAVRPLTLFVLHPIEVLGFGGLWIGVLCIHSFSLGGMMLYLTINTTFGVIGHVGVEPLPRRWVSMPVLKLIGTSTFHARHHQTPTSNFGFYTSIWDGLFRSLDPSYRPRFRELPISTPAEPRPERD